jgi:NitT/TauT family transport system substrate-binding protein
MRYRVFLFVMIFLLIGGLSLATAKITLINPLGPTTIPISPLINGKVQTPFPINVKFWRNPDEALALLNSKEVDFAVLPITAGAIFYTKGIKIQLLGVYEWKVFYLIASKEVAFTGWKSLMGKAIYTPNGRGQTVDVLMRYLMTKNGITPDKDVKIEYAPPQEIVALFSSGKIKYAALPEPFVTLAISGGKGEIVLDFQKAWGESMNLPERIPIAGLFVKKDFVHADSETTLKVENAFSRSVKWMNENLEETLELSKKYLKIPIPVLKNSMSRMNFTYVPISQCATEVSTFLKKIHQIYPKGMPILPDKDFYKH